MYSRRVPEASLTYVFLEGGDISTISLAHDGKVSKVSLFLKLQEYKSMFIALQWNSYLKHL